MAKFRPGAVRSCCGTAETKTQFNGLYEETLSTQFCLFLPCKVTLLLSSMMVPSFLGTAASMTLTVSLPAGVLARSARFLPFGATTTLPFLSKTKNRPPPLKVTAPNWSLSVLRTAARRLSASA
ncbi:unannotated protein [freshwater metagenome]|uniref:Unannotated protein n=1 Tax=freshwater metagenome TaxID=449393 RepID=A0A6J6W398_9ZZZZ